jgi:hypothetical protein
MLHGGQKAPAVAYPAAGRLVLRVSGSHTQICTRTLSVLACIESLRRDTEHRNA